MGLRCHPPIVGNYPDRHKVTGAVGLAYLDKFLALVYYPGPGINVLQASVTDAS